VANSSECVSSLYEALETVSSARREKTAIVFEGKQLSYTDLIEKVRSAASYLHSHGIKRGDAVAVFSQNRPEMLFCYFAAALLGAVFVPLNFNLKPDEVAYILKHSNASLLLCDSLVADLAALQLPSGYLLDIADIVKASSSGHAEPLRDINPDDDLLISYTSGSTGMPKGVVLSHRSQLYAARSLSELWALSPNDTTVLGAPLGFLLGLSTVSTVSLLVGAKLILNRRFHPGEILEDIVRYDATIYNGVPTMFSMMLEFAHEQDRSFDLSKMRAIISSGSAIAPELRERFAKKFGKELQDYFGMTEAYPLFGRYAGDSAVPPKAAAGRLAPGALLRIIGANGAVCSVGEEGELLVKAPSMLKRYHKDPELTAAAFSDGWFKTGDVGRIDENDYVYITGRLKDIIKRGGANVAPAEVESALLRHPAVRGSAVIGVADEMFGEVPVAFVVKDESVDLTVDALLGFAATVLAKYKIPAHVRFVKELPLGKTGKIDKTHLRQLWDA